MNPDLREMSDEHVRGVCSPRQPAPVTGTQPRRFRSGLVARTLGAVLLAACAPMRAATPVPHQPPAALPAQAHDTVTIRGTLRARKTGEPLPNATVRVEERNVATTTDSAGRYTLRVPIAGRGKVRVQFGKMSYLRVSTTVRFAPGMNVAEVSIRLKAVDPADLMTCDPGVLVPPRDMGYSVTYIKVAPDPGCR
jgi:hypothetical protein